MVQSLRCLVGVVTLLGAAAPARAQVPPLAVASPAAVPIDLPDTADVEGELHGVVNDDLGRPLVGAVVSALGSTSVFAISDAQGRFAFRNLPAGTYLVRVHLQGYLPARGRVLQVRPGSRRSSTIALTRRDETALPASRVVEAGVGIVAGTDPAVPQEAEGETEAEHDHDEVAWRMRHARRSVLKDAQNAIAELGRDAWVIGDGVSGLGRAVGDSARLATALIADLPPITGELNLLTTTSFHRPEDLLSLGTNAPHGVAFISLEAPGTQGDWRVRGTITQGDVSSWILAASFARHATASHRYAAGVSYSTQRYRGGNGEALAAIRDGGRNVGSLYGSDDWSVTPRLRVGYGGKYARHDYLLDGNLLSPHARVTIQPFTNDTLRVRASVSHRETAAGAEEFVPPTVGLWLPPERTFSHVSRGVFLPERLDHVELAAEREWAGTVVVGVRAFRQRVDDQLVTVFDMGVPGSPDSVGHYQVGSAGAFSARGWGISVSRDVGSGVRAAVNYTLIESARVGHSPDAEALAPVAAVLLRDDERIHDVTASVESTMPYTATRVFVLYKLNTGFAVDASPAAAARFNVQVNQALPFLDFASARWEMLVAVSNLFHEEMVDSSVYDELFVVRPPKRVLGGVTVRF